MRWEMSLRRIYKILGPSSVGVMGAVVLAPNVISKSVDISNIEVRSIALSSALKSRVETDGSVSKFQEIHNDDLTDTDDGWADVPFDKSPWQRGRD